MRPVREPQEIHPASALVVEMDAPHADDQAVIRADHLSGKCACTWVHYMDDPIWVLLPGNIHPGCFVHGKKEET
jgi:hypothetical protein